MPSRTRDTRYIYPLFSRRNGGADKNSQRKTESAMHNAWRILRKSSTAWLYMPGLRMVDHPPSTNSNRDFRGLSLLSSPKFLSVVDLTGAGSTTRSCPTLSPRSWVLCGRRLCGSAPQPPWRETVRSREVEGDWSRPVSPSATLVPTMLPFLNEAESRSKKMQDS